MVRYSRIFIFQAGGENIKDHKNMITTNGQSHTEVYVILIYHWQQNVQMRSTMTHTIIHLPLLPSTRMLKTFIVNLTLGLSANFMVKFRMSPTILLLGMTIYLQKVILSCWPHLRICCLRSGKKVRIMIDSPNNQTAYWQIIR